MFGQNRGIAVNLRHLEVFCTVVQCESFSGAAEQLFLTQPAVSMQVQAVERHFGVQLLERRSRRVVLTEAGTAVYQWAKDVLASEQETHKLVDEFKRAEAGRIVLGTSMALGSYLLPQIVHQFKREHPSAEIVVRLAERQHEIREDLLAGTIDIGVTTGADSGEGLEVEVVGTERMVFICAPSHRLAGRKAKLEDLTGEPFILAPKGTGSRRSTDQILAEQGLADVRVLMEVGVGESIKRMVEQGVGISVMVNSSVITELEQGLLREISPPKGRPATDLSLVRRPHRQGSPLLEAFIDFLRHSLSELSCQTQSQIAGNGHERIVEQPSRGSAYRVPDPR